MSNPFEKFLESEDPILRKFVFSEILSKPVSLRLPRASQVQSGQVQSGQVQSGQVQSGQVQSGQSKDNLSDITSSNPLNSHPKER
jgi:hypothetical protein